VEEINWANAELLRRHYEYLASWIAQRKGKGIAMAITYSISGGADAAKFTLDASSGALAFKTAPDFEAPGDANKDNIYEVTVKVTDSNGKTATKDMRVTCSDVTDMNANSPPQITSAESVSVPENITEVMTILAIEAVSNGSNPTPPSGPTGGKITNFTNQEYGNFKIDNYTYYVHAPNNPWCITKLDDYTLRFECRPGDRTSGDGTGCYRSEIACGLEHAADNTEINLEYRLMMEPGTANPSTYFFLLGQMHNDDDSLPAGQAGTSPIFALELYQEKLQVVLRYVPPGGNPNNNSGQCQTKIPWKSSTDLVRGRWYVVKIQAKSNQRDGYLRAWLDGAQIVNYTGPLGYGCSSYWEYGIYKQSDTQITFVAQYKNMTGTWTAP
jgi:polysaccharide lyase-like protein